MMASMGFSGILEIELFISSLFYEFKVFVMTIYIENILPYIFSVL